MVSWWWASTGSRPVKVIPVVALPRVRVGSGRSLAVVPLWIAGFSATTQATAPPLAKNWKTARPTSSASQSTSNRPPNSRSYSVKLKICTVSP